MKLVGGMDTGYAKKRGSVVRDCEAEDDDETFSIDNSKKLIQQKDKQPQETTLAKIPLHCTWRKLILTIEEPG
eukprot:CAMPEP_0172857176 /NCGR_PEP_ID=MMETSP1075-20121228/64469_1 /TAXON_ID=2916 /ORGANISM="Ceratium fusus, Strain PA161109" /LENGTH=72 /DNA_ID=CAMNT_0013704457 /DNA_START=148 /DNA_END=362 /DNA_ORIENTATION=+